MRRVFLAVVVIGALCGCGSQAQYVDAGISCTKSDDCPTLRCLPDGGMAAPDAGFGVRACIFGHCGDSCS